MTIIILVMLSIFAVPSFGFGEGDMNIDLQEVCSSRLQTQQIVDSTTWRELCCRFDTRVFKSRLAWEMEEAVLSMTSETYISRIHRLKDPRDLSFRAVIEFESDPAFKLLGYHHERLPWRGVWVGYLESSNKIYILNDYLSLGMKESFNRMREDNSGYPLMDPICVSLMLVGSAISRMPIVIIDCPDDVKFTAGYIDSHNLELPLKSKHRYGLFLHLPSRNSDLMELADIESINEYYDKFDPNQEKFDSVPIEPLCIESDSGQTRVSFTTFDFISSEVAVWEVVIGKDGLVKVLGYREPPHFLWDYGMYNLDMSPHELHPEKYSCERK